MQQHALFISAAITLIVLMCGCSENTYIYLVKVLTLVKQITIFIFRKDIITTRLLQETKVNLPTRFQTPKQSMFRRHREI